MSPASRRFLKLDAPTVARAERSLARADGRLAALIRLARPCRLRAAGRPYAYLVRSILYQQLAGAAASKIESRFLDLFEGRRPRPEALLAIAPEKLRAAGLSGNKVLAVKAVAEAFHSGSVRERQLWHLDDDAVIQKLVPIRGVGEWTVHMLLMSSLGRPDVLPTGDYGVRKGVQLLYGLEEMPKPKEVAAIAESWSPWRSVASWYMWRHDEIAQIMAP